MSKQVKGKKFLVTSIKLLESGKKYQEIIIMLHVPSSKYGIASIRL